LGYSFLGEFLNSFLPEPPALELDNRSSSSAIAITGIRQSPVVQFSDKIAA
jgi:hypothetical protein